MPLTRSIAALEHASLYRSMARTPTVTLPRLKALVSGRLPKFIDVFHNFGSAEIAEDNVIDRIAESQSVARGFRVSGDGGHQSSQHQQPAPQNRTRRLVMYGDDTWLKLFPGRFARADGTTSFFTKDFTVVDDNVTRHLGQEFDPELLHPRSTDWDLVSGWADVYRLCHACMRACCACVRACVRAWIACLVLSAA